MLTTVLVLALTTGGLQAPALSDADRREALQQYQLGMALLASEQWEKAETAFRASIGRDELFTDAHYGLGRALMGQERFAEAVRAYEGCLDAARALFSLREKDRVAADQRVIDQSRALREAVVQIRRQKGQQTENQVLQIEARIRELERSRTGMAGRFEPPPQVLLALGSAHFRNGDADDARVNWEAAVAGNPKLGEGWNNLAVEYMREGRKGDAERAVKNAEGAGFRVNPRLKADIAAMRPAV
ncbi:MAG: tetratricopeptide repeat protein [Vicinamibacterales bacterium]